MGVKLAIVLFQVAMLRKLHGAQVALVRFLAIVLSEMVFNVAALSEGLVAPVDLADKQQLVLLGLLVVKLVDLVPFLWNSLETPIFTPLGIDLGRLRVLLDHFKGAVGVQVGCDRVQIH